MRRSPTVSLTLMPIALAAACALAPSSFAGQSQEQAQQKKVAPSAKAVPTRQLIIKYKKSALAATDVSPQAMALAHEAVQRHGYQMKWRRTTALGAHVLRLDRAVDEATAQQLVQSIMVADRTVEYAEPDRIMRPRFTPNDPSYTSQWHYFEEAGGVNLPRAWDKSTGTGVVVAVIDTGIRPHADLAANLLPGYDFISSKTTANDGDGRDSDASDPGDWTTEDDDCGASDSGWHGTHVAGTVAAVTNNGSGVAGVAYGAKVISARVLGKCGGPTSDIADAIVWASGGTVKDVPTNANPARVLNLSLGGRGTCSSTYQKAIDDARTRNAVIVVAAGNDGYNASRDEPGNCQGVITVAATNRAGGAASYTNYGSIVDVAAPGGEVGDEEANGVLSTLNDGKTKPDKDSTGFYEGTSMAAPHVAGVAALMLSVKPTLTSDDVESLIKSTARAFPEECDRCGTGIVDALAAVDAAIAFTPPTPPTAVAEVEPNNTLATAQAISPTSAKVSGTIATSSDTDYFKATVGAGKSLDVKLTPNASSDFDLELYDSKGTLLVKSTNGRGQVETIKRANAGSAAVTWTVRVVRYSGTGTYTLDLKQ